MQEKNDRRRLIPGTRPTGDRPGRHRAATTSGNRIRMAGHTPRVAAALITLAGLGLAGYFATVPGDPEPSADTAAIATGRQSRAEAADRADRADRPSPTATAPVTPTPSATGAPGGRSSLPDVLRSTSPAIRKTPTTTRKPVAAWVNPLPGAEVTSCFGQRWGVLHAGIDLAQPADTPVRAAGAGTVVNTGWAFSGYGISVVIDHGNGYLTHYAHLNRAAVSVGQRVSAGKVIGYEGSTGDSTGPHLHFEVHNGLWNQIDPAPWMRARGVDLGC